VTYLDELDDEVSASRLAVPRIEVRHPQERHDHDIVANVLVQCVECMPKVHTVEPDGAVDVDVLILLRDEHSLCDFVIDSKEDDELEVCGDRRDDDALGLEIDSEEVRKRHDVFDHRLFDIHFIFDYPVFLRASILCVLIAKLYSASLCSATMSVWSMSPGRSRSMSILYSSAMVLL
jgi:hypothetical protein